jgi:hypothetical protein
MFGIERFFVSIVMPPHSFTPLESSAIYGGDAIDRILIPY